MGKNKDCSMFIKSGHEQYVFFLCCLLPVESIRKTGKIKLTEN